MLLWVRALRNLFLINDFLFFVSLRAESFVSFDDSAVWLVFDYLLSCSSVSGGCFLIFLSWLGFGRNRLCICFCGVIWGGISGISFQQLLDCIIMNESFRMGLSLLQRSSDVFGFHRTGVATVSLQLDIPRLWSGVPDIDAPGRSSSESFLDSFQTLSH